MKYEDYVVCELSSMLTCISSLMFDFWQKTTSFSEIDSWAFHILTEMYDLDKKIDSMFKEEDDE